MSDLPKPMSSYNMSLLGEGGKAETMQRSQGQIFKNLLRIMLVRRLTSILFWVFQGIAAFFILINLTIPVGSYKYDESHYSDARTLYFREINTDFGEFLRYMDTDVHLYPENSYSQTIKKQFDDSYKPYLEYENHTATIYDDKSEFDKIKSSKGFSKIDFEFPKQNKIHSNVEIQTSSYYTDTWDPPFVKLMNLIVENDPETNYTFKLTTMSKNQGFDIGYYFIEWLIDMGIAIAFITPLYEMLGLRETKQYLLLKISGAFETTILGVYFVMDLILVFVYTMLTTMILAIKSSKGTNYFFIFISVFLLILCHYFMFVIFVPIVIKSRFKKYAIAILIVLATVLSTTNFASLNKPFNVKLVKSLLFLPQWSTTMFIDNLAYCMTSNISAGFSNMNDGYHYITTTLILGVALAMIVGYALLFFFLNIMMPRASGIPPVGFKHIFSGKHWKNLFNFKALKLHESEDKPFITVNNINKIYSGSVKVHALNNVSFNIKMGEVTILIGPNGSGKSTLLNSMTGCLNCNSGDLQLYGEPCATGFSELQHHLGICFQDNVIFDDLSVERHLELFASMRGYKKDEIPELIDQCIDTFCLEGCETMKAGTLSGGQKRKLCIAIALIGNPRVVILDEPTAGTDLTTRQEIWKAISSFGITAIVSTHSLEEAESVSSRMFILRQGELIFDGSSSELRRKYHCGYRLTPMFEEGADVESAKEKLLNFCKTVVPSAIFDDVHREDIIIPVSDEIVGLLDSIEHNKSQYQIRSFNIIVEQLENVLYRMYIDDEAADDNVAQN